MTTQPIKPGMFIQIQAQLKMLAEKYDIRILHACESGSRAWGFASPDSDYDVRFLYVHRLSHYFKVGGGNKGDTISHQGPNDLDMVGWDVGKALQLLNKGNASVLEWIDSPIQYIATPPFIKALHKGWVSSPQWDRLYNHHCSMAKAVCITHLLGETVTLKKYLYALRSILAARWVHATRSLPPVPFVDLLHWWRGPAQVREAVEQLLITKSTLIETAGVPPIGVIQQYIEQSIEELRPVKGLEPYPVETPYYDDLWLGCVLNASEAINCL